jgi:CxxC-x17-CxxC domain-containing protein
MGKFGSGGRNFNQRPGNFNRRDRESVTKYRTVCSECGKSCEVPFRPTQGKPVYCDDCFSKKRRETESGGKFSQKSFSRGRDSFKSRDNNGLKELLEKLNVKMDQLVKKVETLTSDQPIEKEKKGAKKEQKKSETKIKKLVKKISKK